MAVGSSFAAMNTMYAAVSRRSKEIGTLRVQDFRRAEFFSASFWNRCFSRSWAGYSAVCSFSR